MMWAPSFAQYSKHKMAFDSRPVPLASKNLQAAPQQRLSMSQTSCNVAFAYKDCAWVSAIWERGIMGRPCNGGLTYEIRDLCDSCTA